MLAVVIHHVAKGRVCQHDLFAIVCSHHTGRKAVDQAPHPRLFLGNILERPHVLYRFGYHDLEFFWGEGLGDKVKGACLHGLDGVLHRRISGDNDDNGIWMVCFDLRKNVQTGHLWHH